MLCLLCLLCCGLKAALTRWSCCACCACCAVQDVTGLSLGPKTSDKLLELLNTGQLRRTEVLEGSEYNKIMALFSG